MNIFRECEGGVVKNRSTIPTHDASRNVDNWSTECLDLQLQLIGLIILNIYGNIYYRKLFKDDWKTILRLHIIWTDKTYCR